jgi:molybdenum cofactor biosynthesis enzyme MoaA
VWLRLGSVAEEGLLDIWRGERLARLRERVAAHDLSLGCERCAAPVAAGRPDAAYARIYDLLPTADPAWPQQLELALSNACNLQCTMCNGDLSSSIRIHREHREALPVVYGDRFFEELDLFLPHLGSLVLLGGEPFLGAEPMRVLERLVELGLAPTCSITTNATQWSARVERLVASLPMHLTVSIDGATDETFAAIRQGAQRRAVVENLHRYRAAVGERGTVSVAFTLLRRNWHELADVLVWADGEGLDVFVNQVQHPPALSLLHAPLGELEAVRAALGARADEVHARLDRNRAVWERQLAELDRLWVERTGERPVSVRGSGGAPAADHHHPGAGDGAVGEGAEPAPLRPAVLRADARQIVQSVEEGDAAAVGLHLAPLVGGSLWGAQAYLAAALGELDEVDLVHLAGGGEAFALRFRGPSGTMVVDAELDDDVHAPSWTLRFRAGA